MVWTRKERDGAVRGLAEAVGLIAQPAGDNLWSIASPEGAACGILEYSPRFGRWKACGREETHFGHLGELLAYLARQCARPV